LLIRFAAVDGVVVVIAIAAAALVPLRPPLWQRPSIVSIAVMVAGGNHGLPWQGAGRQWLRLPVAMKKGGNYGPEAFFQNKIAGRVTLLPIMATSLHAT